MDQQSLPWSLEKHGFFAHDGLNWSRNQVFFEESKQAKVKRIGNLGCTHYIDDLTEILRMIPDNIEKILYDPNGSYGDKEFKTISDWKHFNKDMLIK